MKYWKFTIFAAIMLLAFIIGQKINPQTQISRSLLQAFENDKGEIVYTFRKKEVSLSSALDAKLIQTSQQPEFIYEQKHDSTSYYQVKYQRHWGWWSLLPAITAIFLCFLFKEPLTALLGGIVAGCLLMNQYDVTTFLQGALANKGSAKLLILYLWFLGGLMGIWSKTGAAKAFAEFITTRFVRGPRSAKLVAWGLGVLFFQGGTMSTVLVGTTVKPIADKENISHEELSYIVDSTASPIASQLAFNAWPAYVQSFIFVSGVSFLATEELRIAFFFKSVPFCFYAILAVLGTFLLSIDKSPFLGKKMREAIKRSRETGELDAPDAEPLASEDLHEDQTVDGYKAHVMEFFLPLFVLIGTAIGTFIYSGSPEILWAFGLAVFSAALLALGRGMSLRQVIDGVHSGLKSVVLGSVILLLAVTVGEVSKQTGGGAFLVNQMDGQIAFWLLPLILFVLTIIIAFSTGTSWGTYAVTFPLAMPLAWALSQSSGLSPEATVLFMTLCFAAVMDGSVFGDQCSPISDTTVLSSMCTGCDLMDHVKTQIPQASFAAGLAAILWTSIAYFGCQ